MEEAHYRLLRLLDATPRLTQRELARELGVSLGKVKYCVNALIEKGLDQGAQLPQQQQQARLRVPAHTARCRAEGDHHAALSAPQGRRIRLPEKKDRRSAVESNLRGSSAAAGESLRMLQAHDRGNSARRSCV